MIDLKPALILTGLFLIAFLIFRIANRQEKVKIEVGSNKHKEQNLSDKLVENRHISMEDSITELAAMPAKSEIWADFLDIQYQTQGIYGYIPQFEAKHKKYNNQILSMEGFIYPLEEGNTQRFFMFSYYPISQCFFCGGAGPESVLEVNSKKGVKMNSKRVKIKGKLQLNSKEPERLFYILNEAESVDN